MNDTQAIPQVRLTVRAPVSFRRLLASRFLRNRAGVAGLVIVSLFALLGVLAPVLRLDLPDAQDLEHVTEPPSREHWLGTDNLGRDLLSRVVHGARISLMIGVLATSVGLGIGATAGGLAGFHGGKIDETVMRVVEIFMAFPGLLLALLVVSILGPGLYSVMLAVGISTSPAFARVMRASILQVKSEEFVEAAQAIGAPGLTILRRHILPNAMGPIIVHGSLLLGASIVTASSLSFLGLGPKPPTPEWGVMLNEARNYLYIAPHTTIFPGLAILLAALGFNMAGDALRDALDVRLKMD